MMHKIDFILPLLNNKKDFCNIIKKVIFEYNYKIIIYKIFLANIDKFLEIFKKLYTDFVYKMKKT